MNDSLQGALDFLAFREEESSPFPEPGARIADFELQEEIGRGSGGVVYRAVQPSLQREVALKLVPLAIDEMTGAAMARIEREARVLASLDHPGIVQVYATGAIPGFRWLAMELVQGWSLSQLLRGEVQDLPQPGSSDWLPFALRTLHQVADALHRAHEGGVVHRDVKPSNILVDGSQRAYLIDFGLARPEAVTGATLTEGFVGTPRYASPEQARGEALTPASDVFSLGAVAFEMLVGVPAFSGTTTMEVLHQVQHRDPQWPKSPSLPREMRAVVEKCLEKEIADAYQTAAEVGEEFARLLRFAPVLAHFQRPWERSLRRLLRQPRKLLAIAGLLVLSLGLAAASWDALRTRRSVEQLEVSQLRSELETLYHRGTPASLQSRAASLLEDGQSWAWGILADDALLAERRDEAAHAFRQAMLQGAPEVVDQVGLALAVQDRAAIAQLAALDWQPTRLRERLMAAQLAIWLEQPARALPQLEAALQEDSASYPARLLRAVALRALGRKQEAVADLRLALAVRPESRRALDILTAILTTLGQHQEALELRQRGVERWPDDAFLRADLALSHLRLNQLQQAREQAERAVEMDPSAPWPLSVLVTAIATEPDLPQARVRLDAGLQRHPDALSLILRDGWLALDEGRLDLVEQRVEQLKQTGGAYWTVLALELEAECRVKQGDNEQAFEVFERLSQLDPDVATWPWQAGRCLLRLERLDEAQEWVSRALTRAPQNVELLLASCWIQRRRGAWQEANFLATRALGVEPENGQASYWVARTWLDLGQPGAALPFARQATERIEFWTDAWILRAVIATEGADHLQEARQAYETALAQVDIPAVRADYAEVLDRLGEDALALEQYQAARAAEPDLPTAWCGEGLLRLRSEQAAVRDRHEAVRLLREACRLLPDNADYAAYLAEAEAALRAED